MSFGLLIIALGAAAAGSSPVHAGPAGYLDLSPVALAAEGATMIRRDASTAHRAFDNQRSDFPVLAPTAPAQSVDLAVYVGDRHSGPQLELGALGGGRADAPSLLHVGFGFDF